MMTNLPSNDEITRFDGSCLLLVVECRLSSADCWLLGVAVSVCCWFLVVGCWLLGVGC